MAQYYSVYESVRDFMLADPSVRPTLILDSSCVLETVENLKKLYGLEWNGVVVPRDCFFEIRLLAEYSEIPRVKDSAGFLFSEMKRDFGALRDPLARAFDMLSFARPETLRRDLSPSEARPVIVCFYSAAAAEEFLSAVDAESEDAYRNVYLVYIQFRAAVQPAGRAGMFAEPIPVGRLLALRSEAYRFFRGTPFVENIREEQIDPAGMTFSAEPLIGAKGTPLETLLSLRYADLEEKGSGGREAFYCEWPRGGGSETFSVKIYKYPMTADEAERKEEKLRMLGAYAPVFGERIAFPIALLFDDRTARLCGFVMRRAKGIEFSGFVTGQRSSIDFSRRAADDLAARVRQFQQPVCRVLTQLSLLLVELRLFDMQPLDLSPANILVREEENLPVRVTVIDADSFETFRSTSSLCTPPQDHPARLAEAKGFRKRRYVDFSLYVLWAIGGLRLMKFYSGGEEEEENPWDTASFDYEVDKEAPVDARTDIQTVLKRKLTAYWRSFSVSQRRAFVYTFKDALLNAGRLLSLGAWLEIFGDKLFDGMPEAGDASAGAAQNTNGFAPEGTKKESDGFAPEGTEKASDGFAPEGAEKASDGFAPEGLRGNDR